jgi:hypothetical protein
MYFDARLIEQQRMQHQQGADDGNRGGHVYGPANHHKREVLDKEKYCRKGLAEE